MEELKYIAKYSALPLLLILGPAAIGATFLVASKVTAGYMFLAIGVLMAVLFTVNSQRIRVNQETEICKMRLDAQKERLDTTEAGQMRETLFDVLMTMSDVGTQIFLAKGANSGDNLTLSIGRDTLYEGLICSVLKHPELIDRSTPEGQAMWDAFHSDSAHKALARNYKNLGLQGSRPTWLERLGKELGFKNRSR